MAKLGTCSVCARTFCLTRIVLSCRTRTGGSRHYCLQCLASFMKSSLSLRGGVVRCPRRFWCNAKLPNSFVNFVLSLEGERHGSGNTPNATPLRVTRADHGQGWKTECVDPIGASFRREAEVGRHTWNPVCPRCSTRTEHETIDGGMRCSNHRSCGVGWCRRCRDEEHPGRECPGRHVVHPLWVVWLDRHRGRFDAETNAEHARWTMWNRTPAW